MKGLERLSEGDIDKYPTLNFATKLASWETDAAISLLPEGSKFHATVTRKYGKSTIQNATRKLPRQPREKKQKKSTALFVPDRQSIEALPETITLQPVKRLKWSDKKLHQTFCDSFLEHKFEPIGLFQDESQNHQLEAFFLAKQKLYGVIEQIGGHVFGYSVLCYSLNRGRRIRCVVSIDIDVLESEYVEDFIMEYCIASPIESMVSQLFDYDERMDNKKLAMEIDAESFPDLYAQVYRQFRKNMLKMFD